MIDKKYEVEKKLSEIDTETQDSDLKHSSTMQDFRHRTKLILTSLSIQANRTAFAKYILNSIWFSKQTDC